MRRDRPGSGSTITGWGVATASDTIDTLSAVTTNASAQASSPRYGLSPCMSQIQAPSGRSRRSSTARTAPPVRREGVSATPTRSAAIIRAIRSASPAASAGPSRNRPFEPPTSTATSGRGPPAPARGQPPSPPPPPTGGPPRPRGGRQHRSPESLLQHLPGSWTAAAENS